VDLAPPAVCALDWEESAGISAPLYDIVDAVFELRSRGFFRRQVRNEAVRCACHADSWHPSASLHDTAHDSQLPSRSQRLR
jgi:hypothetical protein